MTISEQHLSSHIKQFMEALDIFSTGHFPIPLISPTQKGFQKTNQNYNLLFPDLYYYYDMKLISLG